MDLQGLLKAHLQMVKLADLVVAEVVTVVLVEPEHLVKVLLVETDSHTIQADLVEQVAALTLLAEMQVQTLLMPVTVEQDYSPT